MNNEIISDEHLHTLLRKFKQYRGKEYGLRVLGYFGSYARGTATSESDVDIVFDTDAPNLFMTAMMKQDLEKLLGKPVNLIQLQGMTHVRLRARIEKEAIYV